MYHMGFCCYQQAELHWLKVEVEFLEEVTNNVLYYASVEEHQIRHVP